MKEIIFFQAVNVPWLIKLHMIGNVDICGTEFQLGQKPNVSLPVQFLTCVSNRAKFFQPVFFFLFFRLCVLGLRGPFTVKPNWVRGDCPFSSLVEGPINQGIHRLSHLCLQAHGMIQLWVCTAETHTPSLPIGHQTASAIDGCDVPSLSAMCCTLCVGRGKRNLILAGFSLGPLLWFYPMLLAWRH